MVRGGKVEGGREEIEPNCGLKSEEKELKRETSYGTT
jgi:hypothetical protein